MLFCVLFIIFLLIMNQISGFLGEYESTLDSRGRFHLPAGFKKQLGGDEIGQFVINRGFEKCLSLYPVKEWQPLFTNISNLNDFDPKVREFRRYFLNGATYVEPDTAGRILIPANLKEHAGLEKDIVLVAAVNKIEIWDSNKYKQLFDSFSPEEFSSLAMTVMTSKNPQGD